MGRVENGRRKSYPVEDASSRTSVSLDEAIAIMLGYADGPMVARSFNENPSDEELECLRGLAFDIEEYLGDESDMSEVTRWRSEIEDEMNKGELSALRLDRTLSRHTAPYITMWSLKKWADTNGYKTRLLAALGSQSGAQEEKKEKKGEKWPAQEAAVLKTIRDLGFDPVNLPERPDGEDWVKSEVRDVLENKHPLFRGDTILDKAWVRLSRKKKVVEGVEPYVPPEERSLSKAVVA